MVATYHEGPFSDFNTPMEAAVLSLERDVGCVE